MNFIEKLSRGMIPLKGRTRITLTNVHTGKKEVVESDNMVSNAVADILSNNFCGLANFTNGNVMPFWNLFGGLMLFRDTITESASNYNIPSDDVNPMIGHAGQTPHATASIYRGNPNGGETIFTDNSVKFVWDFFTNQGNGQISCCSLVPKTLGDMGIKPFDATQNPIRAFGNSSVYNSTFDEARAVQYPVDFANDGQTYYSVWMSGTSFKEKTVKHDLWKFGIMRDSSTWNVVNTRTATIRAGSNKFFFLDANYYYACCVTSATTIQIDKIARSDFAVTTADITISGASLYTGTIDNANSWMPLFAFDSTYLYFPASSLDHFIKINLSTPADILELSGTLSEINLGKLNSQGSNGEQRMNPVVLSSGIVVGDNYIINGQKNYPIKQTAAIGMQSAYISYSGWLDVVRHGSAAYGHALQTYDSSRWSGQVNVLFPYFLSTINNIEPITKSTAQTMKVEYTLQEA